jgi:DNA-binding NarL/FixJ family response regulator
MFRFYEERIVVTTVLPAAPVLTPVKTVLICDERPNARVLLARLLTAGTSVTVTGAVPDAFTLVDAYTTRPADVVFIGVHSGTADGADALGLLLGLHPAATVIVFGSAHDAVLLTAALSRGARGLMLWDTTATGRLEPASTALSRGLAATGQNVELTEREMQVIRGMSEGKSNAAIGRDLYLSEDTVKTHARRLFNKVGAKDRAHAVMLALRHGLLR